MSDKTREKRLRLRFRLEAFLFLIQPGKAYDSISTNGKGACSINTYLPGVRWHCFFGLGLPGYIMMRVFMASFRIYIYIYPISFQA